MKRPPSVIAAIVVFSLLLGICLISLVSVPWSPIRLGMVLMALVMPTVHTLGLFALLRRARWSRVYSIVVLTLWALSFMAAGIIAAFQTHNVFNVIPTTLVSGFFGWLVFSLLVGQEPKQYLSPRTARWSPTPTQAGNGAA